ncbi:MAG: IS701 family transposase [Deltaproteobacteria bacterium]|nr:IS701 family transposase [Deltaproteobacteria bacterium]
MTENDLRDLMPQLEIFHKRFHSFFCRSEGRQWSRKYLMGLLLSIERKNVENIAEEVGAPPRKLQEFLSDSPWDDEGCIEEHQRFVGEMFGAPNGVVIFDDTGFPKKGDKSAGVGRQYSGTMGKTDNCQVGVFMSYASAHGHTLVDRRLYIMSQWFEDVAADRRTRAAIPSSVPFKTKIQLAMEMLEKAHKRQHLLFQWVSGDGAYGDAHEFRKFVDALGKWYCFEVHCDTHVWTEDPAWKVPEVTGKRRGRKPKLPKPTEESPGAVAASSLEAVIPQADWQRICLREGDKGPREFEFARLRVFEKWNGKPGPASWLMIRRTLGTEDREVKFYLSNAPETVSLSEMAWAGCQRWSIEVDFKLAKGEAGLDHYELTKYRGWYHHITLSMLALAFLKAVQRQWGKKECIGYCA